MNTLICGSLAFDNIMVFADRFKNHILPEQIHILNVAFLVPEMRREYGGCAGNIAYNLMLLGGSPLIMATVGDDAAPYLDRLDKLGLLASLRLGTVIGQVDDEQAHRDEEPHDDGRGRRGDQQDDPATHQASGAASRTPTPRTLCRYAGAAADSPSLRRNHERCTSTVRSPPP